MTLGFLIGLVREVLQTVLSLLGLANLIYGNTVKAAQETTPFIIQDSVKATQGDVENVGFGLFAIKTELDTLTTEVASLAASVALATDLAAISGQLTGLSSALPTAWVTPIGNAVWGWPVPTTGNAAYTFITLAGWGAQQRGFPQTNEETAFATALWKVMGTWGEDGVSDPNPNTTFELDLTTILASDLTSADWLNRTLSTVTWLPPLANGCLGIEDVDGANWLWYVDLPIDKWLQLKANLGLTPAGSGAPVWPGLAGVTLGTPVAISSGFTVPGPMHGVIVSITSLTGSKPFFDFDGSISYRNIGALTFQDDNGEEEFPQNLGFTAAVYCPKSMVEAAACLVRADASLSGTVTPWVIT